MDYQHTKRFILKLVFICIIGILFGCASSASIYVAGHEYNGKTFVALYWKNGKATYLTDGKNFAQATSIYVSGTDVYVAGFEYKGNISIAKYWKNGAPVNLTNGKYSANATSIYVFGSDVYVAGIMYNPSRTAVYWKNGKVTICSQHLFASANAIFVNQSDVYVAGEGLFPMLRTKAMVWKNGKNVKLHDVSVQSYPSSANAIFVSNDTIYVAGYEYNYKKEILFAKYWKNGKPYKLPNGAVIPKGKKLIYKGEHVEIIGADGKIERIIPTSDLTPTPQAKANSLYIHDFDIHVAGNDKNNIQKVARYWKNNVTRRLTNGKYESDAKSIYVYKGDVYIAGYKNNGTRDVAVYWKNGNIVKLSNGSREARANSIYVIKALE